MMAAASSWKVVSESRVGRAVVMSMLIACFRMPPSHGTL